MTQKDPVQLTVLHGTSLSSQSIANRIAFDAICTLIIMNLFRALPCIPPHVFIASWTLHVGV